MKRGEIIVADRYYGLEYGFFGELRDEGVSHVIRIRNNPRMKIVEELLLTEADRMRCPGMVIANRSAVRVEVTERKSGPRS